MSFLNALKEGAARVGTIAVCDECVRSGEAVASRGQFGDFSICPRCGSSVTSHDRANYVKRGGEFPHGCCS